jgi:hypothetical protein
MSKTNMNGVEREMTLAEQAAYEIQAAILLEQQQAADAATAAAASARASALAKLAALGLTEAEVVALVGG